MPLEVNGMDAEKDAPKTLLGRQTIITLMWYLNRISQERCCIVQIVGQLGSNRLRGTGEYDKFFADGIYNCAGCGTPLYKSSTKFNFGCGWPAFYEGLPGAINRSPDPDGRRTEITCAACGGHFGHVFKGEGFQTPTDERHCVNSVSIKFISEKPSTSL
ncbi:hypothetical protein L1049_021486 [Liquidambar formosana]|uniref:MsrB domain-containing protein n=1 Tax=Liquidambar formosana TaxID=63359 RepID=A0AAP0R2D4_LIQFO